MPHDPVLVAESRAWFARAAEDLRAAEHEFGATPPLLGDIVFHCQQAAEKTMKGFLTWHNCPFRKTHNLEEIGEQCQQIDPTLKPIVDQAVPLTEYAWKFRYPTQSEEPSVPEAREALSAARDVYEAILKIVPKQIHP